MLARVMVKHLHLSGFREDPSLQAFPKIHTKGIITKKGGVENNYFTA
jgi:hypothetical protein